MAGLVHGTCVSLGGLGALLRGAPGSGKSDLALRFIFLSTEHRRPALVSDDQVVLTREGDVIIASPPSAIEGKIEVRGVGIVAVPHWEPKAQLKLIVDLKPREEIPRYPSPLAQENVLGLSVLRLSLDPFEASAPLKLALALKKFGSRVVD